LLAEKEASLRQQKETEARLKREIENLKKHALESTSNSVSKIIDPFSIIQGMSDVSRTQDLIQPMSKTQPMIIKQNSMGASTEPLNIS
jgi:F0F1-type ATP synthase alpha subunit